jgi:hypothetical protein
MLRRLWAWLFGPTYRTGPTPAYKMWRDRVYGR